LFFVLQETHCFFSREKGVVTTPKDGREA